MAEKTEEWTEKTQSRIREAFELFDKDKADAIMIEEVGTVMRALGAYPTERDLVISIIPSMQDDEPTGYVSYRKFESVMLNILASKEWEPDSTDTILQAFRTIDTEGKGYISADVLEELLVTRGPPNSGFRPKEVDSFLNVARDPETGNVYYEDYVALLAKELNK
jgi:calmodulin